MTSSLRTSCLALGLVVCSVIGIPNLYDNFLIARYIAAAIGLAILFFISLFTKKRWLVPHSPVFLFYLLFILLSSCSILWATNTAEAIYAASTTLIGFLVTVVAYTLLSNHESAFKKTLWISAAVILSIYLFFALFQLFHIENLSFKQLYRVTGINGHKNLLAIMLFVLSGFLLTAIPYLKNKWLKAIPIALFVLSITMVFLLKSRAVWLSVAIAVVLFGTMMALHSKKPLFSRRSQTATFIITFILAFAVITGGLRWFASRSVPHTSTQSEVEYNPLSTSSLVERCLLWEKTYHIADQHPVLGCGAGNWQIHFPDAGLEGLYRADVWNVNFTKPHNEYLGTLAENGYLGLFILLAFLCSLTVFAGSAILATTDRKDFLFGAVTLSVFCGCCVNALFDFPNSRVEHILWMGILTAILFRFITEGHHKTLGKGWNILFLLFSAILIVIGGFRLHGERNSFAMQQAISPFYTIDAAGLPLHWYQGKAEKRMGSPLAIEQFRKAYRYAPYCKENLNDLGMEEYHTAHNLEQAEFYLKEAIRISPNYLYPYFNLAYIYLQEKQPEKAKAVADQIYMDEQKRDILIQDAPFFEPYNLDATRHKIEAEYQATLQLRHAVE